MTTLTALHSKLGLSYDKMDVLVIGTGYREVKERTCEEVERYSALKWLNNLLVPFVTKSNEICSGYWGRHIGLNYVHIYDPVMIHGEMDEASQVSNGTLDKACEPYLDEFKTVWDSFISEDVSGVYINNHDATDSNVTNSPLALEILERFK